jgi:hypothetical protein
MRTILLAATLLFPLAAFADQGPNHAGQISGNAALAASGSLAGVSSTQGTAANSMVGGNGSVITGGISGNYTDMTTSGSARAGQGTAKTATTATQTNIGGTITGGVADTPKGAGNTAKGAASGSQSSQAVGGSAAVAADLGGYVKSSPQTGHHGR